MLKRIDIDSILFWIAHISTVLFHSEKCSGSWHHLIWGR